MTSCGIWIRKKRLGDSNPTKAHKKYVHIKYGTERGKSQMNHDPFGQIGGDRYLEPLYGNEDRYDIKGEIIHSDCLQDWAEQYKING